MEALWQAFTAAATDYVGRILGALLIVAVGWLAVRFLTARLRPALERHRFDPLVVSFLVNSVRAAILAVVVLGVLGQLGVQTTSLLALAGTVGLAVGLSLQGSLANFASGILVLAFRSVRIGDFIEVGDVRGRVAEMLPFHVVVVSADNQRITLPNTLLTNGAVRNHSAMPTRRAQWTLPLTPTDDLEAVKTALRARLVEDKRVLTDPAPEVYVQEWGAQQRTVVAAAWTKTGDHAAVQQELLEALGLRLEETRRAKATAT
jgi:small conductance mechanosensitive channel